MARYLLTIALGPVQGLIGAARRTRDLWCGSWLLSEAARAAARELHAASSGGLIFPAPDDPDQRLRPLDRPGDEANIGNILRVEIEAPDEAAVRVVGQRALRAASLRLEALGEAARRDLRDLRETVWQAQIGDLLEGFAAWVRIDSGNYAAASSRLGHVLAARKATRDCAPSTLIGDFGLPKSSLDGAFETVLPERPSADLQRKLGLSAGEQLDALGVIKRRGGDVEQFTAYSRIAADPWIERLTADQQQRLRAAYEPLVGFGLATRVNGNAGVYQALPYDAQLLFDFRLDNTLSDRGSPSDDERTALLALREALRAIAREPDLHGLPCGAPVPYAAILQADGDRMGELLSRADSADASRDISRALRGFADAVRSIVREHRGHAIYAGGDDVLALVPLPSAMACAQALADTFATMLLAPAERLGLPADRRPTLSVGLGIGHLMEPLGSLRARATQAEKLAKGDGLQEERQRNALAVILGTRSGGATEWRTRWNDHEAIAELANMTRHYVDRELPSRVAYDLRAIDHRLAWLRGANDATARGMRAAEVRRMLDRARTSDSAVGLSGELQAQLLRRADAVSLSALADTLIIARWLAARTGEELQRP